jgi:hypothetical protein
MGKPPAALLIALHLDQYLVEEAVVDHCGAREDLILQLIEEAEEQIRTACAGDKIRNLLEDIS